MKTRLSNPTGRKTEAHVAEVGGNNYYFSYETCIAFSGNVFLQDKVPNVQHVQVRLKNHWGPTTGRHFNDLYCGEFDIVDDEEFLSLVGNAVPENLRAKVAV